MKDNRFKIGDEVIALKSTPNKNSQPRIKGKKYIVEQIMYCSSCGTQKINIGHNYKSGIMLLSCCNTRMNNKGYHWTNSNYFIKVDDIKSAIDEAINGEDYELAQLLTEHLPLEKVY